MLVPTFYLFFSFFVGVTSIYKVVADYVVFTSGDEFVYHLKESKYNNVELIDHNITDCERLYRCKMRVNNQILNVTITKTTPTIIRFDEVYLDNYGRDICKLPFSEYIVLSHTFEKSVNYKCLPNYPQRITRKWLPWNYWKLFTMLYTN